MIKRYLAAGFSVLFFSVVGVACGDSETSVDDTELDTTIRVDEQSIGSEEGNENSPEGSCGCPFDPGHCDFYCKTIKGAQIGGCGGFMGTSCRCYFADGHKEVVSNQCP